MAVSEAHDHRHCIDQALRQAEHLCALRGVRLTRIRRKVLELVWTSHVAVKAYDLLADIKPFEQSAQPATIYRALDFLREQGLIHRLESLNAFIGCAAAQHEPGVLLLICNRCQSVEERPAPEINAAISSATLASGFIPEQTNLEVRGLCSVCSASPIL